MDELNFQIAKSNYFEVNEKGIISVISLEGEVNPASESGVLPNQFMFLIEVFNITTGIQIQNTTITVEVEPKTLRNLMAQ